MAICGYGLIAGVDYFDIDDPIYGKSHLTVQNFSTHYMGSGTWTHTYFTKSYFRMPIRLLIPKEAILRLIWETRPFLGLKQDMANPSETLNQGNATLGMAHRVYSLGLDSLVAEQNPTPAPVALRVYEGTGDKPEAFYDVTEDDEPRLLQMSASRYHLDALDQAMTVALQHVEEKDQECELRLFRVPALNFEALWVNYGESDLDILVPFRTVGRLSAHTSMTLTDAIVALREASKPLANQDDTMGA
jgi:hypothetical protein